MTVGIDACLKEIDGGLYDFQFDSNGDILSQDFFDTAIIVSIFSEKRANESEVLQSRLRRGWIGNESTPNFEIGSKLWLYEQSRLTPSVINGVVSEIRNSLQWLIDDGFLESIDSVEPIVTTNGINFTITIRRPNSKVENRYFTLWDNTAVECPTTELPFIKITSFGGINIFDKAGRPKFPVDVVVNVTMTNIGKQLPCIDTGESWHPDSKITIHVSSFGLVVGSGGNGGRGGDNAVSRGGGGGGGAGFGFGGASTGNPGIDGTLGFGGAGGGIQSIGPNPVIAATNGIPGFAGIIMRHPVTIQNFSVIGGINGGGGGGGGAGPLGANGGAGGNLAIAGSDGDGPDNGTGGAAGAAIITNGHTITFAPQGTINGVVS